MGRQIPGAGAERERRRAVRQSAGSGVERETRPSGPPSAVVRRATSATVLAASVAATVVVRHHSDTVVVVWGAFAFYLGCCVEPMRRVTKQARISWGLAAALVVTALLCIGAVFCIPVTNYGERGASSSVFSAAAGVPHLSTSGADRFADAAWILCGALVVATLVLWYSVMRLMQQSEWSALDHATGDAGFNARPASNETRP